MKKLQKQLKNGKADKLWYALCFALLGLIDQRRGSAEGSLQMTFVNLTGIVVWMLLIPSMKREFWHTKLFHIWFVACIPGIALGCVLGGRVWTYPGQWYTALANIVVIGYLMLYVLWDWKAIKEAGKLYKPGFLVVMIMLALMQLSIHEVLWPVWFLCLFGSFYLIGIPRDKEETFIEGMLLGTIAWFFAQQIIAFGFRPYDYVRYRGLYSGETQNGLFYMIIFCAFTGMCVLLKRRKANVFVRFLCFLLSAGCVSFQLFTGGRASLLGIVVAAVLAYMAYDIIMCDSFWHWLLQGIALVMCIVLLVPAVYGCIRYLPTVLHRPIWFEGEYNADTSIHSYDPWDSERYVSFEEALTQNLGRMLRVFGIQIVRSYSMVAYAAEPGSSPDDPFIFEGTDFASSTSIRKAIYYYYATHLNLTGHSKENAGFYMPIGGYYDHAHNMFLQVAYDHGILAGILFLIWNLWCLFRLLRRKDIQGIISATFLAAVLAYGSTEMAVTLGQITMVLLFIIYYFGCSSFSYNIEKY